MSTLFPTIMEKRYADYPRRWSNEYHFDRHSPKPGAKGACATLASARAHALRAIGVYSFAVVRIFDHRTGQYVVTYTRGKSSILEHEGFAR